MSKLFYYVRKFLFVVYLTIWAAIWTVSASSADSSTVFAFILLMLISLYLVFILRPSKHIYAKNGDKWIKKFTYTKTTENTKNHKDGSFEINYYHHFTVDCVTKNNKYSMTYDLVKNGGISGKTKDGKEYSKKINKQLYLRNTSVLEQEK